MTCHGKGWKPKSWQSFATASMDDCILAYFAARYNKASFDPKYVPMPRMEVVATNFPTGTKSYWLLSVRPTSYGWIARCVPSYLGDASWTSTDHAAYFPWEMLSIKADPMNGHFAPRYMPAEEFFYTEAVYPWEPWIVPHNAWNMSVAAGKNPAKIIQIDETAALQEAYLDKFKALFAQETTPGIFPASDSSLGMGPKLVATLGGMAASLEPDMDGDIMTPTAPVDLFGKNYADLEVQLAKGGPTDEQVKAIMEAAKTQQGYNAAVKAAQAKIAEEFADVIPTTVPAFPDEEAPVEIGCWVMISDKNLSGMVGQFGMVETIDEANYGGTPVTTCLVRLQVGTRCRLETTQLTRVQRPGLPAEHDIYLKWERRVREHLPTVNEDGTLNDQEFEYDVFRIAGDGGSHDIVPVTAELLSAMVKQLRDARNLGYFVRPKST